MPSACMRTMFMMTLRRQQLNQPQKLRSVHLQAQQLQKHIKPDEKDAYIEFSTSDAHPAAMKLKDTRIIEDTPAGEREKARRRRIIAFSITLPMFIYAWYIVYWYEMVIELEEEDKIEALIPGYILKRMEKDVKYRETMLLLRPELGEEYDFSDCVSE